MTIHDEEVLGKAYDARLMRRLLTYLKPYRVSVVIALFAIIGHSVLQLAQPYLMKLAIDEYIAAGDMAGLNQVALIFLFVLIGAFILEYVRTYTLQLTGQRIMLDLRMEIYSHLQLQLYLKNKDINLKMLLLTILGRLEVLQSTKITQLLLKEKVKLKT